MQMRFSKSSFLVSNQKKPTHNQSNARLERGKRYMRHKRNLRFCWPIGAISFFDFEISAHNTVFRLWSFPVLEQDLTNFGCNFCTSFKTRSSSGVLTLSSLSSSSSCQKKKHFTINFALILLPI